MCEIPLQGDSYEDFIPTPTIEQIIAEEAEKQVFVAHQIFNLCLTEPLK